MEDIEKSEAKNGTTIFRTDLQVVNIGLELFADSLRQQGVQVVHVAWEPPAKGQPELIDILNDLL